jgi:transglutaminase-like putative cysteine protease
MTNTRLLVRHETHYEYESPLSYSVQRLHLWPLSFASQTVESWKIECPGIANALAYDDGFGNRIHLVTFSDATGPISIIAEGIVEVRDAAGIVQGVPCPAPDAVFLRQTWTTMPGAAMTELARRAAAEVSDRLGLLHRLMQDIHGRISYEPGATHAHSSAADAFADGKGVCQDHAHILIGMARSLDIPARYVTGYLVTGEGASSTAAHAWAEALVPDIGWVGFDPANCKCPTDHYVRVASGIDAHGITPVRGSRRGGTNERMKVEVRVDIAQQ